LRQSVFAHVAGGRPIETGTEPIYAWIRLEVIDVNPLEVHDGNLGFAIRVGRNYYTLEFPYTFQDGITLTGHPENSPFPEDLTWEQANSRLRVRQPDGLRLEVVKDGEPPSFTQPDKAERIYNLEVSLRPVKGSHADILVAMLPQSVSAFDRES